MKNLSWDDMVFKNRNRSYGAYIIRKEYPSALVASFVFMLVVLLVLFAVLPLISKISRKMSHEKAVNKVIYIIEPPDDMKVRPKK
jgi:protein TonB